MKKYLFLLMLIPHFFVGNAFMDKYDPIERILETENAEFIIRRLHNPVEISNNNINNTYTKDQGSQILRKFFLQNPITELKIEARGSNEENSYYNILYKSTGKTFKMFLLFKLEKGISTIREVKISEIN